MKFRMYRNTGLTASGAGFGLGTISTRFPSAYTEGDAIALPRKALDLGITLFAAAGANGSELEDLATL